MFIKRQTVTTVSNFFSDEYRTVRSSIISYNGWQLGAGLFCSFYVSLNSENSTFKTTLSAKDEEQKRLAPRCGYTMPFC